MGEKGQEISSRNSHSLQILKLLPSLGNDSSQVIHCLVLYGGASPETGSQGDCYFALLSSSSNHIGKFNRLNYNLANLYINNNDDYYYYYYYFR